MKQAAFETLKNVDKRDGVQSAGYSTYHIVAAIAYNEGVSIKKAMKLYEAECDMSALANMHEASFASYARQILRRIKRG